ncbi:MAG: hypothetical protein CFE44_03355 [Burkholderiales bacterium PBB4]|nr:MAG: hypothetical protein CFE44_03355 [Burkholderiales bacterium PBB4]
MPSKHADQAPRATELEQVVQSDLLRVCIDRLNDSVLITEAEPISHKGSRIVWANRVFYAQNGYTPEDVLGRTPRFLQGVDTDSGELRRIRAALQSWQSIRAEVLNYRKDGSTFWNELEIVPIANAQGWYTHWVSVQRDVTARKQLESKMHGLAFYDALTGLPNRRLLDDRMHQALASSKRHGHHGAVIMLDLDNFKALNDTHGHRAGDKLLVEAATRQGSCVRQVDTVARFRGDEFVVLLGELDTDPQKSGAQAGAIAEKIRAALADDYDISVGDEALSHILHHCTASMGVVVFSGAEVSLRNLLKWADEAMYQAKENGGNQVRFHAPHD